MECSRMRRIYQGSKPLNDSLLAVAVKLKITTNEQLDKKYTT